MESCNQLIEQCCNSEALSICRGEEGEKLTMKKTMTAYPTPPHLHYPQRRKTSGQRGTAGEVLLRNVLVSLGEGAVLPWSPSDRV